MKILRKIYYAISFVLFYLSKLVQANLSIAWDIITPVLKIQPAFIIIDIDLKSDKGILLFSNLVSMTPGTLSANINTEKTKMDVHILYAQQKDKIVEELKYIQHKIKQLTL
jgi:multisubunit Na+/H+ antiporter MnhE subunit